MVQEVVELIEFDSLLPAIQEWPALVIGVVKIGSEFTEQRRHAKFQFSIGIGDSWINKHRKSVFRHNHVTRPEIAVNENRRRGVVNHVSDFRKQLPCVSVEQTRGEPVILSHLYLGT